PPDQPRKEREHQSRRQEPPQAHAKRALPLAETVLQWSAEEKERHDDLQPLGLGVREHPGAEKAAGQRAAEEPAHDLPVDVLAEDHDARRDREQVAQCHYRRNSAAAEEQRDRRYEDEFAPSRRRGADQPRNEARQRDDGERQGNVSLITVSRMSAMLESDLSLCLRFLQRRHHALGELLRRTDAPVVQEENARLIARH